MAEPYALYMDKMLVLDTLGIGKSFQSRMRMCVNSTENGYKPYLCVYG